MVRLRAWRCSFTSESLSNFPDDLAFHVPLINRGSLSLLAEALRRSSANRPSQKSTSNIASVQLPWARQVQLCFPGDISSRRALRALFGAVRTLPLH